MKIIKKLTGAVFLMFIAGGVLQAATTGEVYPTVGETVAEASWVDEPWVSPADVDADDGATANVTSNGYDAGVYTEVLKATGYDFSAIPDGATIDGVIVRVNTFDGTVQGEMNLLQLLDTSKARVGTNQCSTPVALTATVTTIVTKGGAAELWGNVLTPAWVKNANFGVAIGNISTGGNAEADVDYVTIEIYFTDTAAPADATSFEAAPGNEQATLTWTDPVDGDLDKILIVRNTDNSFTAPTDGVTYTDGAGNGPGSDWCENVASGAQTLLVTSLVNDTKYYFKAYAYDTSKNYAAGVSTNATPAAVGAVANDHLVITKVYMSAAGSFRWIEIFNPTAGTLTLSEVDFTDKANDMITYNATDLNVSMASGDYYLITDDDADVGANTVAPDANWLGWTPDGGNYDGAAIPDYTEGGVKIKTSENATWDAVAWDTSGLEGEVFGGASYYEGGALWDSAADIELVRKKDGDNIPQDTNVTLDDWTETGAEPDAGTGYSAEGGGETWPSPINKTEDVKYYFTSGTNPGIATNGCEQKLIDSIAAATSHVYVAIYNLLDTEIKTALNDADTAGRIVRVIVDSTTYPVDGLNAGITQKSDGDASNEMHHKFVIADGNTLWTGSGNFTDTNFGEKDNNFVVITSTAFAKNYEDEFQEMWSGNFKASKTNTPTNSFTIAGISIDSYFNPQNDSINTNLRTEIQNASESAFFSIYTFYDGSGDVTDNDGPEDDLVTNDDGGVQNTYGGVWSSFAVSQNRD